MQRYFTNPIFTIGGTPITLTDLIAFASILLLTWILSRVLEKATIRAIRLRKVKDEGAVHAIGRVIHYLVLLAGLGLAFNFIGVNPTALFAAGALFAAVLGFALQNISQNFFSGFILLFERSITPGDILEVEGHLVKVSEVGLRSTIGRTLNEEEMIIPNSTLVQTTVKNYTLADSLYRLRTVVGVLYSSDMALVRETLENATRTLSWRSAEVDPRILMKQFGDSAVNFEVSVWIDDPWKRQQRNSDLHEAVWWALKEAGIVIAFPQLDVHFDPVVVQAMDR